MTADAPATTTPAPSGGDAGGGAAASGGLAGGLNAGASIIGAGTAIMGTVFAAQAAENQETIMGMQFNEQQSESGDGMAALMAQSLGEGQPAGEQPAQPAEGQPTTTNEGRPA